MRIGRTDHAERARRRHQDDRLRLAGGERGIKVLNQMQEEGPFRLVVPVGLLNGAATAVTGRTEGPARCIGAELMGGQILLFEDLDSLEVGKLGVADVLQHQRLGAVADYNPFVTVDQ